MTRRQKPSLAAVSAEQDDFDAGDTLEDERLGYSEPMASVERLDDRLRRRGDNDDNEEELEELESPATPEIAEPEEAPAPARTRGSRASKWVLGLIILLVGAGVVFEQLPQEGQNTAQKTETGPARGPAGPVPVTIADVGREDVPIYLDGLGTVQASNTVAIHSQVDGKLQSVNFVEGQLVKKGDVLAIVDPRPFQAALDQAKAKKAEDEAQLASDQKDLARFKDLAGKGAGTVQAVDQQQAKVLAEQATIEADEAAIESAAVQLGYATITAPIEGRIGIRQVDAGNIVHASDTTPITVLTDLTPAMVMFTLPQRDLAPVRAAMQKGKVQVLAMDQDNAQQLGQGELLLIDNEIDPLTSTIKLKASFPNEGERLWPGEFVHAHVLIETLQNAVTIPEAAVQRNSDGLFVWVIKSDDTAETRKIAAGPTKDDITVVTAGLNPGEKVVVSGQYRLRPGSKVQANTSEPNPNQLPGPAAASHHDGGSQAAAGAKSGQNGEGASGAWANTPTANPRASGQSDAAGKTSGAAKPEGGSKTQQPLTSAKPIGVAPAQ